MTHGRPNIYCELNATEREASPFFSACPSRIHYFIIKMWPNMSGGLLIFVKGRVHGAWGHLESRLGYLWLCDSGQVA